MRKCRDINSIQGHLVAQHHLRISKSEPETYHFHKDTSFVTFGLRLDCNHCVVLFRLRLTQTMVLCTYTPPAPFPQALPSLPTSTQCFHLIRPVDKRVEAVTGLSSQQRKYSFQNKQDNKKNKNKTRLVVGYTVTFVAVLVKHLAQISSLTCSLCSLD